jgi:hypothetical protein
MSANIYRTIQVREADSATPTVSEAYLNTNDTAGKAVSQVVKINRVIAPGAGPINIYPQGVTAPANVGWVFEAEHSYDASSASADNYLTYVINGSATGTECGPGALFNCDTSLTVTNPDATYSARIKGIFYIYA